VLLGEPEHHPDEKAPFSALSMLPVLRAESTWIREMDRGADLLLDWPEP
jgi:hypothetical protein